MQSIKHSLSSFSAKIFSLAEETLDDHSIHHISAKDYETFSNGCTKIINDIEQQIEKEKEKITTFYLNITNAPAVSHALSNGQLELDQENLNYRCCLLTDALTTFANFFFNKRS